MKANPELPAKLIIGLGNPGTEFENTYHNVGFLAIDALLKTVRQDGIWKDHKKIFSYIQSEGTIFIKPLTFMNESGVAVREALKKFGVPTEEMAVLHDESDLAIGTFKVSLGKNAAGHNGVQSIIDHVGTNEFRRIRIGIRPAHEAKRKKASALVLSKITKPDLKSLEEVFGKINELIGQWFLVIRG
jgi:PTH1 family peptidyl-tRNA hydrolase